MKVKIPEIIRITNPLWVEKLESRKTWYYIYEPCEVKGVKLDICKHHCCIVGEALNLQNISFNNWLSEDKSRDILEFHKGCHTCVGFSMGLFECVDNLLSDYGSQPSFEKELQSFANHLEEKHPEYIEAKKK